MTYHHQAIIARALCPKDLQNKIKIFWGQRINCSPAKNCLKWNFKATENSFMKFYMTLFLHILHHSLKLQRNQTKNVEMTASGKLHVRQSNIVDPGVLNVLNFHSAWHITVIKWCQTSITTCMYYWESTNYDCCIDLLYRCESDSQIWQAGFVRRYGGTVSNGKTWIATGLSLSFG